MPDSRPSLAIHIPLTVIFKLPRSIRSRSSPSPPRRADALRKQPSHGRNRRKFESPAETLVNPIVPTITLDWSTSYQAGSSSSPSVTSTDDDETEEEDEPLRGRPAHENVAQTIHPPSSSDSSTGRTYRRRAFARSKSPKPTNLKLQSTSRSTVFKQRAPTPSPTQSHFSRYKLYLPTTAHRTMLPTNLKLSIHIPYSHWEVTWLTDTRKAAESALLLASSIFATYHLSNWTGSLPQYCQQPSPIEWISAELYLLSAVTTFYILWTHTTFSKINLPVGPSKPELRDAKNAPSKKSEFGFIWMSVPKNYRTSIDDGVCTGLILGPLISTVLLRFALHQISANTTMSTLLSENWRVEVLDIVQNQQEPHSAWEALVLSRFSLVNLSTFCSTILLFHLGASAWLESRSSSGGNSIEGERRSVPRSEGRRTWYYILFTFVVTLVSLAVKATLILNGIGIWQHLSFLDMMVSSSFFQFTMYTAIRLAHRGFTLGELALVCFGGTTVFMELLNVTVARIWPVTTMFVKTYRLPTPLLVLQIAMIGGSFLTGFLLAPFLVLSRHVAQRPVRRLKFPAEKQRHRRTLALGFYVGTVLIVGGLIGLWTRWCLGKRDPWLWVIFWLFDGRTQWSRFALLAYWASLCSLSVAGWSRQLARSRRYRSANSAADSLTVPAYYSTTSQAPAESSTPMPSTATTSTTGMSFPNLPNLPNGANVSIAATDFLNAAEKQFPTLGLNGKRKFFHALTVVMFIPGIALDPAFTHLSFSVAFALFVFAEYVRYFAIYPFGAAVHVFMNEFLDSKDSGTAILSHFYLLTGCAGSLWLESRWQLLLFTGTLSVGVGDALASVVGRQIGRYRWSATTSKTVEGSLTYAISIIGCAWVLRLLGLAETFSTPRYTLAIVLSALLEALSVQNDNLTVPLYMWSMLVILLLE